MNSRKILDIPANLESLSTQHLFIGSFLSEQKGSLSASETVAQNLKEKNIKLTSFKRNKWLRMIDILINILTFKGSIIHIEVYSGQAFIIAQLSALFIRLKKSKLILTLHGGMLIDFHKKNPKKVEWLLKEANEIYTPSYYLQTYFSSLEFKISYLPNSINLANFEFKRTEVKKLNLLWVRGFSEIYNPLLAIKTLYILKQKFPTASLTMIGPDAGLLNKVKDLCHKLNLNDAVTFTGPVPNNQLYKYYQSHHVYLNTTSYESFGIAVIEAAACGIPIVSSSVGEIPYLWSHKENILLSKNLDENEFAQLVEELFTNETLEYKLSLAGRKKAEEFSWDNVSSLWLKLLESKSN